VATRVSRGPYLKGVERRQEILDQALEVFADQGASKMSLRAVSARLGISHGAVQHYFSTLEELMLAGIAESDRRSEQWAAAHAGETLMEELLETARHNASVRGLVAAYTSLLAASIEPGNTLARTFFAKRFAYGRALLAEAIQAGSTGQRLHSDRAGTIAAAALVIAAFDGLQVQWLLDPDLDIAASVQLLAPIVGDAPAIFARYQASSIRALEDALRAEASNAS
jgi:AcrR family transcriptional regulator